jgi:hypothetical protein
VSHHWTIPPCFKGEVVAVVGAGPSLTGGQVEAVRASGARSIVVNRNFEMFPDADWLHVGDAVFWKTHPAAYEFAGIKTTLAVEALRDGVRLLRSTGNNGFERDPSGVRNYNNSGMQAIAVAVHTGARRVVLVGFDGRAREREVPTSSGSLVRKVDNHWHGQHSYPCTNPTPNLYKRWDGHMRSLADALARLGGPEVVNATPGSAYSCWPMMDLGEALR